VGEIPPIIGMILGGLCFLPLHIIQKNPHLVSETATANWFL
jgi:hypothetical protein